jgi:predicted dehydrogenase
MSEAKELRLGVIGAGGRGGVTFCAHQPENGVRIVAACDINDDAFGWFKQNVGNDIFTCSDYRDILSRDDVDAVFICAPDHFHEDYGVAALEAGKHTFLEKPMAITIEGCDRLLETARRTGTKLYLGHNMRHFPVVLKMKELIDAGLIGEVKAGWCRHFVSYGGDAYFKDWHAEQKTQTGLLLQKGAHDIDVLHWLCGGYSKRVVGMGELGVYNRVEDKRDPDAYGSAKFMTHDHWPWYNQTGVNPFADVEDLSMMLMTLDNGVMASYQQCHYTPDCWRNYTVIGTEGRIENFNDCGRATVRLWNRRTDCYSELGDVEYQLYPIEGSHGGSDPALVQEFLDFVRFDIPTNTSPVAARFSVAAGYQATMSLRSGSAPMDVPDLDPELIAYFENGQKA